VVAREARRLWADHPRFTPLLTSFQPDALEGARSASPDLPRGLLVSQLPDAAPDDAWLTTARELGCCAVVLQHRLWSAERVAVARAAGLRCLTYTVNDRQEAQRLIGLGLDGLITDRVDLFDPVAA
jgi:glycerophosphoryl diester phosphodiesterase